MLQSFGCDLLYLILPSCFGCGDFAQALSLLVTVVLGFLLERSSEEGRRHKAQFLQLKGLFLLSLRMLHDFIAFLSSLTQQ